MNYHINEEIKELSKRIKVFAENSNQTHPDNKTIRKEARWNYSSLFSEILFYANNREWFIKKDLNRFHKDYEDKNSVKIDLNNLLKKQWIRIINDQIRLPKAITENLSCFREYNKEKEKSEFVKTNIETFEFLYSLHLKIGYRDENKLTITKNKLTEIIKKHKSVFTRTPSYEAFLKKGYFKEIEATDNVIININCGLDSNITGLLWEKILIEGKNKLSKEKLDEWFDKISNISYFYPELNKYIIRKSLSKLIDVAIDKILNESDFDISEKEVDKLWWDRYIHNNFHYNIIEAPQKHIIDDESFLSLYTSLKNIENAHDIIHYQKIRAGYLRLIYLVIANDDAGSNYQTVYPNTKKLLANSLKKPYVFWEIISTIKNKHPEIIPYLLIDERFTVIAQELLTQIKINNDALPKQKRDEISVSREEIISEFWLKSFGIILSHIQTKSNYEIIAEIISNILIFISKELFSPPNRNQFIQSISEKEIIQKRYEEVLKQLKNLKDNSFPPSKLFPQFIQLIFENLKKHKVELPTNKFVSLSLYKYDIYLKLIEILRDYINSDEFTTTEKENFKSLKNEVVKYTFNLIKQELTSDEIVIQDNYSSISKIVTSKWINEQYGFEKINWETLILELNEIDELSDFCSMLKSITLKKGDYDWNQLQTYKIRILLRIQLTSYKRLFDKQQYLSNKDIGIKNVLSKLQSSIVKLLEKHSKKVTTDNRVDIFTHLIEKSDYNYNERLFTLSVEVLNLFPEKRDREKIIKALANSEEFVNLYFALYNLLLSERDKKYLQIEIEKIDIDNYLENSYYIPNIEGVLIDAVNSNMFTEQAETIFNFYEKIISKRPQIMNDNLIYRIKLLLAYRNNDEDMLSKIEVPKKKHSVSSYNHSGTNYKEFYKSLFKLRDNKLNEALSILKKLQQSEPENLEFRLRKLYVKVQIAEQKKQTDYDDAVSKFQNIYDELQKLLKVREEKKEEYFNQDLANLINLISCNYLEKYNEFDNIFYNSLNSVQRLQGEYLELTTERYIKTNEYSKASELINQAENFHKLRNNDIPDFILELKTKLNEPTNIRNLRNAYTDILGLKPEDLIKTIPSRINPFVDNLGEFLLWEICFASNQFLTIIKSVKKYIDENEFTDFLQIIINGQLKAFYLRLEGQKRAGSAESKVGIGSTDIVLPVGMNDITIEAVRAYAESNKNQTSKQLDNLNTKRIKGHIEKIFNYSTSKKFLYNLVYYQKDNFNEGWKVFTDETIPQKVIFPKSFELLSQEEITKDFGNDAIKVLQTIHENKLTFYHIFLNLNYIK